jgi:hypothetical protein
MKKIYLIALSLLFTFNIQAQYYTVIDSFPFKSNDPDFVISNLSGGASTKVFSYMAEQQLFGQGSTTNIWCWVQADTNRTSPKMANTSVMLNRPYNFSTMSSVFIKSSSNFVVQTSLSSIAKFFVELSFDNKTTWVVADSFTDSKSNFTTDLSSTLNAASNKSSVYIRFRFQGDKSSYVLLDNFVVFRFNKKRDANMILSTFDEQYRGVGSDATMLGAIQNRGSDKITSYEVTYMVDGNPTKTETFSNLNINGLGTHIYTITEKVKKNVAGKYLADFKITKVNGIASDEDTTNNSFLDASVIYMSKVPAKNVLFEEFTTAACQWCPEGHFVAKGIETKFPELNAVNIHAGFGTDQMTTPQANALAAKFAQGAPTAMIDRQLIGGAYAISRTDWEDEITTAFTRTSPVGIKATNTYDPAAKRLKVDVEVGVYGYFSGSLRANCYIVNKVMSGTGTGWDQLNASNANSASAFYQKGNPILNYKHEKVERQLLAGTWGSTWKLASVIDSNKKFNFSFNDITTNIDTANSYLVVFVSDSGTMGTNTYQVYNSLKLGLNSTKEHSITNFNGTNSIITNSDMLENARIFPNPVTDNFKLAFNTSKIDKISITITNSVGAVIKTTEEYTRNGQNIISFDNLSLSGGMYFVNISNNNGLSKNMKFIVK